MLDTTKVPEDLNEANHLLSGSIAMLLSRFRPEKDWVLNEEEAGIVPDSNARHFHAYGVRFGKGQPGYVAAELAERAMNILIDKGLVIEPSKGQFRLDPHGHLIPDVHTRDGLLAQETQTYTTIRRFPISASEALRASHFVRTPEPGAHVLNTKGLGEKTGFVILPSGDKSTPWKFAKEQ